jgi:hypothetical protein
MTLCAATLSRKWLAGAVVMNGRKVGRMVIARPSFEGTSLSPARGSNMVMNYSTDTALPVLV